MTASRFNGSVCLVTGSAQGIGPATARRLAAEGATADAGPLDALVNNAGTVGSYEPITEITLEDWDRVVRINQTSVFYGMRTVLPGMVERGRGAVVNVSSMGGIIGASGVAAYAANGVRIHSVHPGFVVTPMTEVRGSGAAESAGPPAEPSGGKFPEPTFGVARSG